jgi:hypothetical protein
LDHCRDRIQRRLMISHAVVFGNAPS